jgi:hypothetical protein
MQRSNFSTLVGGVVVVVVVAEHKLSLNAQNNFLEKPIFFQLLGNLLLLLVALVVY